ncbi:MAG: metallophosphoesterase family protein, partial [Polyangia bacterium]
MAPRHKSVETRHMEERDALLRALGSLDRRSFLKVAAATAGAVLARGLLPPHSFQLVNVAHADPAQPSWSFAYISDTHLYDKRLNERFVRAALKAVDDVNALSPQPDFVLFGGDLAQLGKPEELAIGQQILKGVKAPLKMMVGEHDWFLDLGEAWQEMFGPPSYSFDWKGVHFVVLMSVFERDFWTARKMTPVERMQTVAGLDNGTQSRFEVGEAGRKWLQDDLNKVSKDTPLVVFSHSPLYKYYRDWNFWTEDADEAKGAARAGGASAFSFAYISDTHLYKRTLNDRFVRAILKAVDDVNALSPQPDFVLFGGDLAQLGAREELELGAQILKSVKAPVRMMVGEHDWFLDMGDVWKSLFGAPQYSFDHKGVHFVTLMSVQEKDFWTARKMTPQQRMQTVAGLDNGVQSRFEVGQAGRDWLKNDLARLDKKTPLVVFSHSPLYKYYRNWNFWTDDAEE